MPSEIVVDASVARSAGETQVPVSSMCRDFLVTMYQNSKFRLVFSDDLKEEWDKHSSKFSTKWLATMYRAGRVTDLGFIKNEKTRKEIIESTSDTSRIVPMLKDVHLVDAALATEEVIISRDDRVRNHFRSVAGKVACLKKIMWINPTNEHEDAVEWLLQGGETEKQRQLGHNPEQTKQDNAVGYFSSPISEM